MASLVYNRYHYNVSKKLIDLSTDDIKVAFLTSAYTPNKDHAELCGGVGERMPRDGELRHGRILSDDEDGHAG